MRGGNKLAMVCHSLGAIGRAQAERALRRSVAVGWRLGIGYGCAEGGIGISRGIARQLMVRKLSCRVFEVWGAWCVLERFGGEVWRRRPRISRGSGANLEGSYFQPPPLISIFNYAGRRD
jgi:hypothetical protein